MERLAENALLGAAIWAAIIIAALLTYRWFMPLQVLTMQAPRQSDPEAVALVSREFLTISAEPRAMAVIPISKPPPTPGSRPYIIPKAGEGERIEPEPVVEASSDLTPPIRSEPDVCAREGGRKVTYMRHHHEAWRCVYRRRR